MRRPTPVQSNCWPSICGGRDVVAIAATKTGKTLSYAAPLASKHFTSKKMTRDVRNVRGNKKVTTKTSVDVKSVVLCSTRRNVQVRCTILWLFVLSFVIYRTFTSWLLLKVELKIFNLLFLKNSTRWWFWNKLSSIK